MTAAERSQLERSRIELQSQLDHWREQAEQAERMQQAALAAIDRIDLRLATRDPFGRPED